jgi:membrane protease YdiL (CAAX protease family)
MERRLTAFENIMLTAKGLLKGLALVAVSLIVMWVIDLAFGTTYWSTFAISITPHWWAVGLGLLLFPAFTSIGIICLVVVYWLSPNDDAPRNKDKKPTWLASRVLIGASAGPVEEIACRGVLQNIVGFWLTACVFALVHFFIRRAWEDVARCLVPGAIFGAAYYFTGNLWVGIVMHTLHNAALSFPPTEEIWLTQADRLLRWLQSYRKFERGMV